jgi:hypothetical protein
LRGQVPGQHLTLGPFRFGLLGAPGRLEGLSRLATLLRLAGEHLEDVLVGQIVD